MTIVPLSILYESNQSKSLIERCLSQERAAQLELYNKYKNAMFTIALRITGSPELAADAMQEGFVYVFMNLQKFRGESSIGAWIKTIIIRHAIKQKAAEYRYLPFDPESHDADFEIENNLDFKYLDSLILNLPDGYRRVFTLIEIEGYSHKACAELLGISENTSRSQLFHSKKILKHKLNSTLK